MKAIVCVDKNWGIGSNNDLLYHIPADMKFFKEHTMGNVVVMGLATLLSLPGQKALPGRTNVVLCDDLSWSAPDVTVCHSMPELLETLKQFDTESVYVCGGASVYAQLIPYCDTAYVTKVDAGDKAAEKFFPNLDNESSWSLAEESEVMEHKELQFRFTTYKNSNPT